MRMAEEGRIVSTWKKDNARRKYDEMRQQEQIVLEEDHRHSYQLSNKFYLQRFLATNETMVISQCAFWLLCLDRSVKPYIRLFFMMIMFIFTNAMQLYNYTYIITFTCTFNEAVNMHSIASLCLFAVPTGPLAGPQLVWYNAGLERYVD